MLAVIKNSKAKRNKPLSVTCGCLLSIMIMLLLSGCGGGSDKTYGISGRITSAGSALAGVTVTLAGDAAMVATTDANGNYSFNDVPGGTFTITPTRAGSPFRPLFRTAWLSGIDGTGFDFVVHALGRLATANHTIYVKDDGSVWAWGNNSDGQIGDGSVTSKNIPVQISGLSSITAVAAGFGHTLALKNDGTVWSWGNNSNGQLGDGSMASRNTPAQVSGLSSITAVAAGSGHTVALKNDGTVWTWGNNSNGQLGNGSSTSRNIPAQISGLSSVTAIAAGAGHTVVLKNDGTVWAWGNNSNGQLGDGSATSSIIPVQVKGLSGMSVGIVTAIAAGYDHTVVLKNDGTVWAWGNNATGQLGNGNITPSSTPIQVNGLSGVTALSAGFGHTIALKSDGTVWTWGNNAKGQLGNGFTNGVAVDSANPVQVNVAGVTHIAAGHEGSAVLTGVLKGDGTVWAWGSNSNGQLGNGLAVDSANPVQATLP
jgi:alpha-tubulin suppressor-like RCC1 family protein